jgi:hypothetical protein
MAISLFGAKNSLFSAEQGIVRDSLITRSEKAENCGSFPCSQANETSLKQLILLASISIVSRPCTVHAKGEPEGPPPARR